MPRHTHDPFHDFNARLDREMARRVDKTLDRPGRTFGAMAVLAILANLALLAGAIIVVVIVLRVLGVIA